MTDEVKLCLIVARARNGVIGANGGLPWRLSGDLVFFKKTTLGKPIIMGRNTWESLPRQPLPGRDNIVLTKDWAYAANGARVYSSFPSAIAAAKAIAARAGQDEVFIIGGGAVYDRALPIADRIYLTEVDVDPEGDTYFPALDEKSWVESGVSEFQADEKNEYDFRIRVLERNFAA
ncbi:MAG: dihydrofolate reductase [Pseudomonadota bacterium]